MIENLDAWHRLTLIAPPESRRVLVSNGEVQGIATFVDGHWLFDNAGMKDMVIHWWQNLSDNPPIIVSGSATNGLTLE